MKNTTTTGDRRTESCDVKQLRKQLKCIERDFRFHRRLQFTSDLIIVLLLSPVFIPWLIVMSVRKLFRNENGTED